jgi:hypothetical protein
MRYREPLSAMATARTCAMAWIRENTPDGSLVEGFRISTAARP